MNEAETLRTYEFVHDRQGVVAERVYAFIHLAFKLLQVGSVEIDPRVWRPVTHP